MMPKYRFNRNEFAGSLGDLGTILPLALGMIMVNGLSPMGVFFSMGLFYALTGVYYGLTVPVEPMKVIGAYAIATAMSVQQIQASTLLMAGTLALIAATGSIDRFGRYIPKAVIRGIQVSTGLLLMVKGVEMMGGNSTIQHLKNLAEPYLTLQTLGPLPIGLVIGTLGIITTLGFLNNRKLPAGLIVILLGMVIGLVFGTGEGLDALSPGLYFPELLPHGFPSGADFSFVILAVVLPQMPMTLGNAVLAQADLSKDYFGDAAEKMTYASLCVSMAAGNVLSFLFGGMPMCHGAGGLAAHYRFGAKTAGSNLIIGGLMMGLPLILGAGFLSILFLIPMAILGVLLIFAGSQLAMTIIDMNTRNEIFVVTVILAVTLASNLAIGAVVGMVLAHSLKRIEV
ncbi:MAG: putative sulfate/molybdate transporter [Desulfobacterales bacterium]|nr:putative sulfate/molybdate transporter [Desulfobacterales bacterium]